MRMHVTLGIARSWPADQAAQKFPYLAKAARFARRALPGYAGRAAGASTIVGKRPAVAGAVGSTALAISPVRVPR